MPNEAGALLAAMVRIRQARWTVPDAQTAVSGEDVDVLMRGMEEYYNLVQSIVGATDLREVSPALFEWAQQLAEEVEIP